MFTISIIGEKGGTGKTLTAANLAVAAARRGHATVGIDLDPQTSLTRWHDRRIAADPARDNPLIVPAPVSRLRQTIEGAQKGAADFVFIDVAGRSESAAVEAARLADFVVVPISDDLVELETLANVANLVRLAGSPPHMVLLNCLHPSVTRQADELRGVIRDQFGMQAMPMHLCRRDAYSDAFTTGLSAEEFEPAGRAAQEIRTAANFIIEFVNNGRNEHVQDVGTSSAA